LCLTKFSTVFQLYRGGQFYWRRKPECPEKTTDLTNLIKQYYIENTSPDRDSNSQRKYRNAHLVHNVNICIFDNYVVIYFTGITLRHVTFKRASVPVDVLWYNMLDLSWREDNTVVSNHFHSVKILLFSSARSRDFDGLIGIELLVSMYTTKTPIYLCRLNVRSST
jgi:hypothetical protein